LQRNINRYAIDYLNESLSLELVAKLCLLEIPREQVLCDATFRTTRASLEWIPVVTNLEVVMKGATCNPNCRRDKYTHNIYRHVV
jgi:hypothetical protein